MTIIIDFDHTIFDTHQFRMAFPIGTFLKTLFWHRGSLAQYLFSDTIPFLKERKGDTLILMTYGPKRYQKTKVESSRLTHYFQEIVFAGLEHKGTIIQRMLCEKTCTEPVVFVDDRLYQLDSVYEHCPTVEVVRMRRPEQPDSDEESSNKYHEVTNMGELSALLKTF